MSRDLRRGDKLRASWSEDVRMKNGSRVYVSTALETEATSTSLSIEIDRLMTLMETAHLNNIRAAQAEEK